MKFNAKKTASLALAILFLGFFVTPVTLAAIECDEDGDGYISVSTSIMKKVSPNTPYDDDGNYSPLQWSDYYNTYKAADKTDSEECQGLNFKKGMEPKRCDAVVVGPDSNVYDPSKVTTPLRGSSVNPGAFDTPGDSIDQDCDGADGELLAATPGGDKDLGNLVQRSITLLSRVVATVSVLVMIWGGIMFATAAGDEQKTSKAKKAILGAVIGLIVGLLAPTVVNLVVSSLG